MKNNFILIKNISISLILLMVCRASAVVIGSNSAVSLQPSISFPSADNDNAMLGFAWFKNGFTLEDSATSCLFDTVFPVSGVVNLNGGTLTLNQDLIFNDITTLQTLGNVVGNNHYINFCTSIVGFPSTENNFEDVNIFINNDFTITSSLVFSGSCIFNGNGNSLILGENGYIIVAPGSTLKLENLFIQNIQGNNLQCADDSASLILQKTTIVQSDDYAFSSGSIKFLNSIDWVGSYTFVYDSSQTSTIGSQSKLHVSEGIFLSIGRHDDTTTIEPLAFEDASSILELENSILSINPHGMQVTKGKIAVSRDVYVDINSTTADHAFVVGNGIKEDDIYFELYPACTLTFIKGLLVFDVISLNILESRASSATISRGATSGFEILQSIDLSNITLEQAFGATTQVAPGKTTLFNNVVIKLPTGSMIVNGYNLSAAENLLNGNQSINVTSGIMPLVTYIANTGNMIAGNGSISGPVILQDSDTELTWALGGTLLTNMIMNGGSIFLETDMTLGSGVYLSGPSTIHLRNRIFSFGQVDLTLTDPIYFDGANDGINIYSNVTLENTWTFSGVCVFDGNGHVLDLGTGNIIVEKGSHLTLSNLTLKNVWGDNIKCLDGASVIVLDSVDWQQADNFVFEQGSLQFKNAVNLLGDTIFAYKSSQVSTILSHATVSLDSRFTFSYDPGISPDLLAFENNKSALVMYDQSILHATMQGLNLTKGTVSIQGNVTFVSEVSTDDVVIDNGITIGDCIGSDDLICTLAGSAQLAVTGSLNYKNINARSFNMQSNSSALLINDDSSLNLYQNLNGLGGAFFGNNSTLGTSPDASLIMSSNQLGTLNFVTLPNC